MHSEECGWAPQRYREAGTGFVVREMTVRHLREAVYGEELHARTWIHHTMRDTIMRRETVVEGVLLASAQWVHIGPTGGPARAPRELVDAFGTRSGWTGGDPVGAHLPHVEELHAYALPDLVVTPWWTEMDPLAHVNHPRYLDWMEEALCQWLAGRGVDPIGLVPVAERLRYRTAAVAGDRVVVRGARIGRAGDAAVFAMEAVRDGKVLCEGTLVRAHLGGIA